MPEKPIFFYESRKREKISHSEREILAKVDRFLGYILEDQFIDIDDGHIYRIRLSRKNLFEIPPPILDLINLRSLSLSFNLLTTLPDEVAKLKNLEKLDIIKNQFKVLPACVAHLPSLDKLDASYNKLDVFPATFIMQPNGRLNLANNCLRELPDSLAGLPISELCLARNQFHHVPTVIRKFPILYYLDLQENPLENLEGLPETKINLGLDMKWWKEPALANFYLFSGRDHCPLCFGTEVLDLQK